MADRYHNPDPLIQLIGPVNESTVILEGKEYPALLQWGTAFRDFPEASKEIGIENLSAKYIARY